MIKKIRPRITPQEYEVIKGIREACKDGDLRVEDVKHGWIKNQNSSLFFKNPEYKTEEENALDKIKEGLVEWTKGKSRKVRKYKARKGEHLLIIDPADVHIGKLCTHFETGDEYNSKIAVKRVFEGVDGILKKAEGFDIEKILFVGGNDILHVDTPRRTTTGGTPQDTDGMWYTNFMIACKLYQEIIEDLSKVAPVHFVYNPSNHDYTNGFFLAQLIEAYFHKNKNVTFDVSIKHRKYTHYGKNLIGTTHGDGAKMDALGSLMANEEPKLWGETKHRYFYTHHLHHKTGKDLIGCTVEALRSPSGTDSWHKTKGFTGVPKAIEGYVHHKEFGQVARLSHIF
jgi:hypothetical protein